MNSRSLHYCLSILFLVFSFHISAQHNFADTSAIWIYQNFIPNPKSWNVVSFEKDTLINAKTFRKFNSIRYFPDNVFDSYWLHSLYFHDDDGVIEFCTDGGPVDTLYNFKAELGDSWSFSRNHANLDYMKAIVIEDTTYEINGEELKFLKVLYTKTWFGANQYVEYIQEIFGTRLEYLLPWDADLTAGDGGFGGPPRCYYDQFIGTVALDISEYLNTSLGSWYWHLDCDQLGLPLSIKELSSSKDAFRFYPNPARDYIEFENSATYEDLRIVNLLGQTLLQTKLTLGRNRVDISRLDKGAYFIILDQQYSKKMIKAD